MVLPIFLEEKVKIIILKVKHLRHHRHQKEIFMVLLILIFFELAMEPINSAIKEVML